MLNERQQLFVLEYQRTLNASKAAINAGYSERTAYAQGHRLLKNVEVQQALEQAMKERTNTLIADIAECRKFWSETMRDEECDMKHRLRASELLVKSCGGFTEHAKVEVKETTTLADLMLEEYQEQCSLN